MPVAEDQIAELRHAYQVLGVPLSASTSSIKQAYRKLVKRWHPDHYPSGTPEYAEATQMTQLINGAYTSIENGPLRYHVDACPADYVKSRQAARPSTYDSSNTPRETLPKTDWLEFWVRFVCGAMFGALFGFRSLLFFYDQPSSFVLGIVATMLVFGLGAALIGDNFWHSFLRRWWMWW
jgi:curved DNA-binding protein CbpA